VELFPAIDIQQGRVVRAARTGAAASALYHPDPVALAETYAAAGARWVHVVDLDRAHGDGDQTALIARIVKRLPVPVQACGGLDAAEPVAALRDAGVQRILLAAQAAADAATLDDLVDQFAPDNLGVALDVEAGRVWARDWPPAVRCSPGALTLRARAAGIGLVVLTDIGREGRLGGADVEAAAALAFEAGVEVVVSGGVNGLDDLRRARDAGLAGAVVGRALFERRFTLVEALACCSPSSPA
jgi:phosphoribosylformimino-5-aminoimidazole carboxamide ribotide isomerase